MSVVLSFLLTLRISAHSRAALQLEILALHTSCMGCSEQAPAGPARDDGPLALGLLARLWTGWRTALVIVKPETVIAWHRRGFRLWWNWKIRRRTGRPTAPADVRTLIRTMAQANPRWGASRIHGELVKLGVEVCQATVAKYMGCDPQ